jgi:IS30 family transposase
LLKNLYDAEHAHVKAHETISESRSGLCICEEEIKRLNAIIGPLVQQGQSIHQIYVTHENELMCSEKTIYNYIDAFLLDVRNIDLPREVKFRERYKKPEFKVDKGCRIGRNYETFLSFIDNNPNTVIVQMDSVIGTKGGKCLLTVHFVETNLMLAFLRESNTSQSLINVYNDLDGNLGRELLQKLRFVYKYSVVNFKDCISIYKGAAKICTALNSQFSLWYVLLFICCISIHNHI